MSLTAPTQLVDDLRAAHLLSPAQLDSIQKDMAHLRTAQQLAEELLKRQWLTKFQAEQAMTGHAGDLNLGPYRLIDIVGEGGMGVVFKAYHQRLNRFVALKTIHNEVVDKHPDALKRFLREAQAAAQLAHPNVVVLYEESEIDGIKFLAMEYVEGTDLHRMVQQQGPLPIPTACEYIKQTAAGLQHAHEMGLIHRDVKPSNLLVTHLNKGRSSGVRKITVGPSNPTPQPLNGRPSSVGTVKILDMGLARLVEALDDTSKMTTALTQSGSVIGTPDFISPEQARDASSVDYRADLYSLGCTFYFLLTARPPFPDGTSVEKLLKHQRESPLPLEQIRRGVPPEVLQVVYRLMEKNAEARFQSAQEVVERLSDVQQALHSAILPREFDAAAVVSAGKPKSGSPPTAQLGFDSLVIPARKVHVLEGHTGYVTALSFSPDGRLLASGGLDGVVHLWKDIDLPRCELAGALRNHLGELQAITFAPHKPYLVTASAAIRDGHMWRWNWTESDERKVRSILPGEPPCADALAFSADGKRLAASSKATVYFWNESRRGLERESVLKGHGSAIKTFGFSPDGKRLVLACEDTTIRIWEFGWFKTAQKAVCEGHKDPVATLTFAPNGKWLASAGSDRIVRVWDAAASGTVLPSAELQAHTAPIRLVRFTPRSDLLLSVGDGGQVFLWDVAAKSVVREWMIDKALAASVALSPDARWLATGTSDGRVFIYDLDLILVDQMPPTQAGL
jgi:eukaryotic-like serine/threonine-protein kinase